MQNEITVIVPTYNRKGLLGQTLDSILSQEVASRVVVIDDGSTDDTASVLACYAGMLEWIHQENRGEVRTVNRGLRLVDTRFFTIVNSDDPLLPGALRQMIDALDAEPGALAAYCDWIVIDEASNAGMRVRVGAIAFDEMMLGVSNGIGPGAVFDTVVLDLVGFRNPLLKYSADLDYWHRVALAGTIVYVPQVLATHRVHSDSASMKDRGSLLSAEVINLRGAYTLHPRWQAPGGSVPGSAARCRLALSAAYFSATFVALSRRDAARLLLRSFFLAPMRALTFLKGHGIQAASAAFDAMDGTPTRDGASLLRRALDAASRQRGLRLLARAMHTDLVGAIEAIESLREEDVRAALRRMTKIER